MFTFQKKVKSLFITATSPEKAQHSKSVLNQDHNHVLIGCQDRSVIKEGGANSKPSSMDPHHDLKDSSTLPQTDTDNQDHITSDRH